MVRRRLRLGLLSPATWRCWPSARATGERCLVCETAIVEPDVEYSIEGTPSRFAHLECYKLWVEESAGMGMAQLADVRQPVSLIREPDTLGKVMATLDGGRLLYVLWMKRAGYERRLTKERATDLRPSVAPEA